MTNPLHEHHGEQGDRPCMSRRQFLLAGGALVALTAVPGMVLGAAMKAVQASYPRQKVGRLSKLKPGNPLTFNYPFPDVSNILVKLGAPAGGGIGPAQDVVAFNQQCTHMGGPLSGTYKADHQILGPCPMHLTTFDLTKHGMVITGHATESLPQILLELQGDDIYAVGVMGLIYGYADNTLGRGA
jgi:arsenite oxidase small subunit